MKEKIKDLLSVSPLGSYDRIILNSILGEITRLKLGNTPEAVVRAMLKANLGASSRVNDLEADRIRQETEVLRSLLEE